MAIPFKRSTDGVSSSFVLVSERQLSVAGRERLTVIRSLVHRIGLQLGLNNPKEVQIKVHEGAHKTAVALWYKGAPLIAIPRTYLGDALVLDNNKGPVVRCDDWRLWNRFVDASPNEPVQLANYIRDRVTLEARERLRGLARRFGQVITQLELEAELAHELGHIRQHHLNPKVRRRVRQFWHGCARVLLPTVILGVVSVVGCQIPAVLAFGSSWFPIFGGIGAGIGFRYLFSDRIYLSGIRWVRRRWELEADAVAAECRRCCLGNIKLYKREMLTAWLANAEVAAVSMRAFASIGEYPSDASRLRFFSTQLK